MKKKTETYFLMKCFHLYQMFMFFMVMKTNMPQFHNNYYEVLKVTTVNDDYY